MLEASSTMLKDAVCVSDAMSRLSFPVQASQNNAQKQLQRTSQNLTDSISAIDAFEEQLHLAGARYTFLQQVKAYIADLCDMLQVNVQPVKHLAFLHYHKHYTYACSGCMLARPSV